MNNSKNISIKVFSGNKYNEIEFGSSRKGNMRPIFGLKKIALTKSVKAIF